MEVLAIFVGFLKSSICFFCRNSRYFLQSDTIPITELSTRVSAFIVIPVFLKIFSASLSFHLWLRVFIWMLNMLAKMFTLFYNFIEDSS